jgi:membrane protein
MTRRLHPQFFWLALRRCVTHFGEYKIPKKSASLAYYTTFSLAPIFYLILSLGSFFYSDEILEGEVFIELQEFVGLGIAELLQDVLSRTIIENTSNWTTALSLITLLIAASGVFVEIQDSINEIWSVEVSKSSGLWAFVKDRLLSFSIIVAFGFLFLVSLLVNSALDLLRVSLEQYLSTFSVILAIVINNVVLITIVGLLFYLIFKVLPDVKLPNRIAISGALLTTLLFLGGKYVIGRYLSGSNLNSVFGAGGTVVILLSWVYYTSMILYFGAAYTRNLAIVSGEQIGSEEYASFVKIGKKKISDKHMIHNTSND